MQKSMRIKIQQNSPDEIPFVVVPTPLFEDVSSVRVDEEKLRRLRVREYENDMVVCNLVPRDT